LDLDYLMSSPISGQKVEYAVYSDKECKGGVISGDEIDATLVETSDRSVQLSLLLNPHNIHGALYVSYRDDFAVIEVCTRVWVTQPGIVSSPVSPPRDSYVIIKADLNNLQGIVDILDSNSPNWGVDVFRCDHQYRMIPEPAPIIRNGDTLRLCLKPTERTIEEGIYLALVNSFNFERDNVVQTAVESFGNDAVTEVICERGSTLCAVESVLSNDFFHSEGEVKAVGIVYLQQGSHKNKETRMLRRSVQADLGPSKDARSLYVYNVGDIVGRKAVEHVVSIQPSDEVYSAEAFRCNANNDVISEQNALHRGEQIKICIRPDARARSEGVYINSIESFSYERERDGKVQLAVDSFGQASKDEKTEVQCSVGARQCSFNSTLRGEFFSANDRMFVSGYVTLQFGAHEEKRQRARIRSRYLQDLDDDWEQKDLGFAGKSEVTVLFNVVESEIVDEVKSLLDRWNELSDKQKLSAYITAAIIFCLIFICCLVGCLLRCCKNRQRRAESRGRQGKSNRNDAQHQEAPRPVEHRITLFFTGITGQQNVGVDNREKADLKSSVSGSTSVDTDEEQRLKKTRGLSGAGENSSTTESLANSKKSSVSSNSQIKAKKKSRDKDTRSRSPMMDDASRSSDATKKKSRDKHSRSRSPMMDDASRNSAATKSSDAAKMKSRDRIARSRSPMLDDASRNSNVTKSSNASKRRARDKYARSRSPMLDDVSMSSAATKSSNASKRRARDKYARSRSPMLDDVSMSSAATKSSNASKRRARDKYARSRSPMLDDVSINSAATRSSDTSKKKSKRSRNKDTRSRSPDVYTVSEDNSDGETLPPTEQDICFEAEEHPGTQALVEAIQQTLEELGAMPYSPTVYKSIKHRLSGRSFFICDVRREESNGDTLKKLYDWRKVEKREQIDILRLYYERARAVDSEKVHPNEMVVPAA